jgi:hypothetical protein
MYMHIRYIRFSPIGSDFVVNFYAPGPSEPTNI